MTTPKDLKPVPSLLIVDDESDFREALEASLSGGSFEIRTASDGAEAINELQKRVFDLIILDVRMPRVDGLEVLAYVKENTPDTEVVMLSGGHEISIAVDAMQHGAFSYLSKPFNQKELHAVIQKALDKRRLTLENRFLRTQIPAPPASDGLIGESPCFRACIGVALKLAPAPSPVLIQGESGTGKELFARLIYRRSGRSAGPFVTVNCSAIPESLIESELFGYMRGAFTDAKETRPGLVEIAHKGTLFLDEIGDISLNMQPKLLRFLQFGEFRRVGGKEPLHADVRVISATNRDLAKAVEDGAFREDLLYRLNVLTLNVPALRERKEDIPLLARHFLSQPTNDAGKRTLDPAALGPLQEYHWPGNVRELENVIVRASILAEGDEIGLSDLGLVKKGASVGKGEKIGQAVSLEEIERLHIAGVLSSVGWNKPMAAGILDISLKTLYTKIQKYGLEKR